MRVYTFLKIFALVTLFVMALFLWYRHNVNSPSSPQGGPVTIVISEGEHVPAIARKLHAEEVVDSVWWFKMFVWVHRQSASLQAGTHEFFRHSSIRDSVAVLTGNASRAVQEVRVTLPEGLRSDEMELLFLESGMRAEKFDDTVASLFISDLPDIFFDGRPRDASWEGYLFPDTYNFYTDAAGVEIVEKMVHNFGTKMTPERIAAVRASGLHFYEVLTIASIVEKELKTSEERRIGAGIFLQRLQDHYPLESDATINFITGKKSTQPSHKDLGVDSAYNTYKYIGLPPGPIANPSLDAIDAVLHPTQTDYYFFLTTPDDGHAVFAKTFDEHLQNKAQYYP